MSSPRPKGRENNKDIPCRNIPLWGYCKWEKTGCTFNHDAMHPKSEQMQSDKRKLNVESPAFKPFAPKTNGSVGGTRGSSISPQAAGAALFVPKASNTGAITPPIHSKDSSSEWLGQDFQDFVPGAYDTNHLASTDGTVTAHSNLLNAYDPFTIPPSVTPSLSSSGNQTQAQINPYAQDNNALSGAAYYQAANGFSQPLQYHLYAPMGPRRDNLLAYQRTAHDFFLPDNFREDLQRRSEATLQVLPNSTLPSQIDHFHSLVPLDTNNQKNTSLFGYHSWVYKAVSAKDGATYILRRLEGFRLTNEQAIRSVAAWKRINSGNVVSIHDAFTTRAFGDSSLIFVTDYHPLSKTLSEHHFTHSTGFTGAHGSRIPPKQHVPEQVLWSYLCQVASALKAIHSTGLAARLITPSKILLTSQNRIRLNACAVLDVTMFDSAQQLTDLQHEDLLQLARLILYIISGTSNPTLNIPKAMEQLSRSYSERLKECLNWLLNSVTSSPDTHNIDTFLTGIAPQLTGLYDNVLHAEDTLTSSLARELENGRLFRLLSKINFILERPEQSPSMPNTLPHPNAGASSQWSETGERYILKLFRDYVFHHVDANGAPVLDLAHALGALNRLDAGTEDKVVLVSRDDQNSFVVSNREVKRAVEGAWTELIKASRVAGGRN
ncbi:MAG: PAB-dependent poly(A)-specific ribonuclease subunit 3 [Bogoriella megaspora]|nr:MAG: PAB-dependent poly(A)-specific ribonuclease subunit 3 [Bogoriella megaspora]